MSAPPFHPRILSCLKSPGHLEEFPLAWSPEVGLTCPATQETFALVDGVPSLLRDDLIKDVDVTRRVRDFYEENPFPSYEGLEDFSELVRKGTDNPFSRDLLKAIGYNKTVLEVGCGTGQLSHFLQLNNNHVLGIDMTQASLRLAAEHKERNQLSRVSFARMNIFDMAIRDESFDVVISHGVLHHTFDARRAFAQVARKVKPGGLVMVGLYNYYARVPTWIRGRLFNLLGPNIDFVVRTRIQDKDKARIWINDQYRNPHETWHSIDEVQGWFDDNGLEFVNCYPPILGTSGESASSLFEKTDSGTAWLRVLTQLGWLFTIAREGALFDLIGRKRPNTSPQR